MGMTLNFLQCDGLFSPLQHNKSITCYYSVRAMRFKKVKYLNIYLIIFNRKNGGQKVSLELMYLLSLINTSFSCFNLHLRSGNFTQFANYYIFKLFSWNRWQPITLGIQISLVTSNYVVVQSLFHSFQCFSSIRAIGNQLNKKKKALYYLEIRCLSLEFEQHLKIK